MFIIKNKKIFFTLTFVLVAVAIAVSSWLGFSIGVDFTGGSLLEVSYEESRLPKSEAHTALDKLSFEGYSLRESGERGYILRTSALSDSERVEAIEALSAGEVRANVERFTTIGPTIGEELRSKALLAIVLVIIIIVVFVSIAFRKVSEPVSSWKYGVVAIITLVHDIVVPTGVFAIYGYITGAQVDVLFVMALLAILGYSINDTIVIFDRIRENLRHNKENNIKEDFDHTVGKSLSETYARSINTSLTTIFVLGTLFFLGGSATSAFVFTLLSGVIAGAYSSLFLAAPLLTTFVKKPKA
ncbi:MAG: protein translocase subunit SecF [Parcubacteria group bacterium CG11_big_fil_rev_8_21_14_0_20_39_22]|nr:MAG: protein translocase subunit SecF [Parcubacteria group bacterium CG11_big_fil_rev_8_21_14_0_20_39_22]